MNKNIDKSLVKEGLKEDTSYLNLKDLDFGWLLLSQEDW
jgi:hypothetical protein